ncbi:spidroin-2-like [Schistocerca piceifrons]|uniref:spidroin-2-like n=1 Tax=Schistocerca piceifrons TaxID=274613 RepID=UPI001F5FE4FF|nr:spidroin-2-like [Schistocerca piceifrons]
MQFSGSFTGSAEAQAAAADVPSKFADACPQAPVGGAAQQIALTCPALGRGFAALPLLLVLVLQLQPGQRAPQSHCAGLAPQPIVGGRERPGLSAAPPVRPGAAPAPGAASTCAPLGRRDLRSPQGHRHGTAGQITAPCYYPPVIRLDPHAATAAKPAQRFVKDAFYQARLGGPETGPGSGTGVAAAAAASVAARDSSQQNQEAAPAADICGQPGAYRAAASGSGSHAGRAALRRAADAPACLCVGRRRHGVDPRAAQGRPPRCASPVPSAPRRAAPRRSARGARNVTGPSCQPPLPRPGPQVPQLRATARPGPVFRMW